jgi:hypothetical protein
MANPPSPQATSGDLNAATERPAVDRCSSATIDAIAMSPVSRIASRYIVGSAPARSTGSGTRIKPSVSDRLASPSSAASSDARASCPSPTMVVLGWLRPGREGRNAAARTAPPIAEALNRKRHRAHAARGGIVDGRDRSQGMGLVEWRTARTSCAGRGHVRIGSLLSRAWNSQRAYSARYPPRVFSSMNLVSR